MTVLERHRAAWKAASADFSTLAHGLDDEQWHLPTDCPGWSVGDVVAHVVALEAELVGDEPLRVTIDKAAPHIKNPVGIFTERGVVARRSHSRDDVLAELDAVVARRGDELDAAPLDDPAGDPPRTPGGIGWSWERLLSSRTLDVWVHEQDIRRAIGTPGGLDSVAAEHAQAVFVAALPYVVAKVAGAPAGTTVVVDVTGPVSGVHAVGVEGDGRGSALDDVPADPTVRLTLDTETFTILAAGRREADRVAVRVTGDEALAGRILRALAVTP